MIRDVKKCFGKHHCWNQVERNCAVRNACLLEWGKDHIDKIRSVNPTLAQKLEAFIQ